MLDPEFLSSNFFLGTGVTPHLVVSNVIRELINLFCWWPLWKTVFSSVALPIWCSQGRPFLQGQHYDPFAASTPSGWQQQSGQNSSGPQSSSVPTPSQPPQQSQFPFPGQANQNGPSGHNPSGQNPYNTQQNPFVSQSSAGLYNGQQPQSSYSGQPNQPQGYGPQSGQNVGNYGPQSSQPQFGYGGGFGQQYPNFGQPPPNYGTPYQPPPAGYGNPYNQVCSYFCNP